MAAGIMTEAFNKLTYSFCDNYLEKVLREEYHFDKILDNDSIKRVKNRIIDLLVKNKYIASERKFVLDFKTKIKKDLKPYVEDENTDIDGLIRFRTKNYVEDFLDVVDYVVELSELEADLSDGAPVLFSESDSEKIASTVRRHIEEKDSIANVIYVKFTKMRYSIREENVNKDTTKKYVDLFDDPLADFTSFTPGEDPNYLLSVLIALAPKKLVLINSEQYSDKFIIDLINKIFKDRIES